MSSARCACDRRQVRLGFFGILALRLGASVNIRWHKQTQMSLSFFSVVRISFLSVMFGLVQIYLCDRVTKNRSRKLLVKWLRLRLIIRETTEHCVLFCFVFNESVCTVLEKHLSGDFKLLDASIQTVLFIFLAFISKLPCSTISSEFPHFQTEDQLTFLMKLKICLPHKERANFEMRGSFATTVLLLTACWQQWKDSVKHITQEGTQCLLQDFSKLAELYFYSGGLLKVCRGCLSKSKVLDNHFQIV